MKLIDKAKLLEILKADIRHAGNSARWADKNNVSISYVSLVLSGQKLPGEKICRAIGYRPVLRYEQYEKI